MLIYIYTYLKYISITHFIEYSIQFFILLYITAQFTVKL